MSHEVRAEMKAKAAAEGGEAASFAEVAKAAGERWQALAAHPHLNPNPTPTLSPTPTLTPPPPQSLPSPEPHDPAP